MRKEEDRRERLMFPKTQRMSHNVFSPERLGSENQRYSKKKLKKSMKFKNDKLQRTFEDFELETDDSVVEVEKAPKTQQKYENWGNRKHVKSLSPSGRQSMMTLERDGESQIRFGDEMYQTRESFKQSQYNPNMPSFSRMSQFRTIRNKAKSVLEKSNFLRRKHFKGDTLHKGEGKLFMTKGLTNSMYNSAIVKANTSTN